MKAGVCAALVLQLCMVLLPETSATCIPRTKRQASFAGSMVRKLDDRTVVRDCWDYRSGVQKDGTNWKTFDNWRLSCNNGTIKVVACIASGGVEIPVGRTETIDRFWHKCEESADDVRYVREPSCTVNGEKLHVNDTFKWGHFKRQCQEHGYNIVGCYYFDSEGEQKELGLGQSADEGAIRHLCVHEANDNGSTKITYQQKSIGCKYDGEIRKAGESWVARHKRFKCNENGGVSITACVTDGGTEIEVGSNFVSDNFVHRCYKIGNVIYYHGYPCGPEIGVSCNPDSGTEGRSSGTTRDAAVLSGANSGPMADGPLAGKQVQIFQGVPSKLLSGNSNIIGARVGDGHVFVERMVC